MQDNKVEERVYPVWHNAVAGGIAGAGSRILTAPLDLIRIRRQLNRTQYPSESLVESWRQIVKTEGGGVLALFRGNVAAIYLWVGYAAVQFSLYNRIKEALQNTYHVHRQAAAFGAGATAGLCATLATYPFDVCRTTFAAQGLPKATTVVAAQPTRMMRSSHMPFSSLMEPHFSDKPASLQRTTAPPTTLTEFTVQLYRTSGWRGFYAGAGSAVLQILPYQGLNFWLYDVLTMDDRRIGLSAWAGSISGAVSKIIVYPVDTVKRRMQGQAFYQADATMRGHEEYYYRNSWDCARRISSREGLRGFYRGVVPSVLKTTLATSLSFSLFRGAKNGLESLHDYNRHY